MAEPNPRFVLAAAICLWIMAAGRPAAAQPVTQPDALAADGHLALASAFGASPRDVVVVDHFAIVAVGPVLQVFDVADPAHPRVAFRTPVLDDDVEALVQVGRQLLVLYAPYGSTKGRVDVFALAELPRLTSRGELPGVSEIETACADGDTAYLIARSSAPRLIAMALPPD